MPRAFNGTADYYSFTGTSYFLNRSAAHLSLWIKTSVVGTARLTAYQEGTSGAADEMFVSVNDGTAGRIRAYIKGGGVVADVAANISINDGAWHLVEVVRVGLSDHRLYVDRVLRASSVSVLTASAVTGSYVAARSGVALFSGTIGDIAVYSGNLSAAESDARHARTAHALTPAAVSCVAWYDNASTPAAEQIAMVTAGSVNGAPALVANPDGELAPVGMTRLTDPSKMFLIAPTTRVIAAPGTGANQAIREPGNVLHTPADLERPYKVAYTRAAVPYDALTTSIHYAWSLDQQTWTDAGVIIPSATMPCEDPFLILWGETVYLYCENKTGGTNAAGIALFKSVDNGRTFTLVSPSVLDNGVAGTWDETDVSSPTVAIWNGQVHLLYEGRSPGNIARVGLAQADHPEGPFAKHASNPVLTDPDAEELVPDDLLRTASGWLSTAHPSADGTARAYTAPALTGAWTKRTTGRTLGKFGVNTAELGPLPNNPREMSMLNSTNSLVVWEGWGEPSVGGLAWPTARATIVEPTKLIVVKAP